MRIYAIARNPFPVVQSVAKPRPFNLRTFHSIDIRTETTVNKYSAIPLQLHFNVESASWPKRGTLHHNKQLVQLRQGGRDAICTTQVQRMDYAGTSLASKFKRYVMGRCLMRASCKVLLTNCHKLSATPYKVTLRRGDEVRACTLPSTTRMR